jgi:hypothetical protein
MLVNRSMPLAIRPALIAVGPIAGTRDNVWGCRSGALSAHMTATLMRSIPIGRADRSRFDPPLDRILIKIDEMVDALRRTRVGARVEDVVIAYSPGYFPAEFWQPAEARLRPALEQLYEY